MAEPLSATPDSTPATSAADRFSDAGRFDRLGNRRRRGDRGEGVISAAIAVLIIAFLGAAMWVGFNTIWENAEDDITEQVEKIGG